MRAHNTEQSKPHKHMLSILGFIHLLNYVQRNNVDEVLLIYFILLDVHRLSSM